MVLAPGVKLSEKIDEKMKEEKAISTSWAKSINLFTSVIDAAVILALLP
jgi:hypothetical protein